MSMRPEDIHVGDYVQYRREPDRPLQVLSAPYMFGGQAFVTARNGYIGREGRMVGMFALEALEPWPGPMPGQAGSPPRPGREGGDSMREKDMQIIGALYMVCFDARPSVTVYMQIATWCDQGMSPTMITAALIHAAMTRARPSWSGVAVNVMAAWVAGAVNAYDYWCFVRAREEAGRPLEG